jgi:hypothetical protein
MSEFRESASVKSLAALSEVRVVENATRYCHIVTMNRNPSDRQLEMERRVDREESADRRTIMWVQCASSVVLLASTLLAWANRPRIEGPAGHRMVHEIGHTVGFLTKPAGPITLALGALGLMLATFLRKPQRSYGWLALVLGLSAVSVNVVEIVQLLLGRRNWLDTMPPTLNPSLANAIGAGVWFATVASIALLTNALTYLWREYRLWRRVQARRRRALHH